MLVATFGPNTAWQGREIIWDVDRFILVGHGAIPAAGVLDYDRLGQLVWAQPELRFWVAQVHGWETGGQPAAGSAAAYAGAAGAPAASGAYGAATPTAAGGAAPSGRKRLPTWAIVLIVLAVAFVVISAIVGAVLPSLIMRTTESIAHDAAVRSGVRTIQVGIESYAADHSGQYPPVDEVNWVGLSRYISVWPVNPYTDLPMADGGGQGNFRYDVSADGGVYKLTGYGRDGQMVIDLTGGSGTSV
jgi:type II secretory pathway pseudopilin PulG